jgi:hypothetical protein
VNVEAMQWVLLCLSIGHEEILMRITEIPGLTRFSEK